MPGPRGTTCPSKLHDHPLPEGYVDASEAADKRLKAGWKNMCCGLCNTFGWVELGAVIPPEAMVGQTTGSKDRAVCPDCLENRAVNKDGRFRTHSGLIGMRCAGSGKPTSEAGVKQPSIKIEKGVTVAAPPPDMKTALAEISEDSEAQHELFTIVMRLTRSVVLYECSKCWAVVEGTKRVKHLGWHRHG